MTHNPSSGLDRLGDVLHSATTADLQAGTNRGRRGQSAGKRTRTKLAMVALAAALAVPAVAVAADALTSDTEVARSLPNGTVALLGTEPTCTTVREGVEFECRLDRPPSEELAPGQWKGTVEPTVGDDQHVNGGCRSENADGTLWRCYVGEEAVRQNVIGASLLGEYAPGPSVG
jgi:hypothetical protein